MNRNLLAALLILLLGVAAIVGYKLLTRWMLAKSQEEAKIGASDAADSKVRTTIRGAGDNYLGYFFLVSPEMKRQTARRGLSVDFTNDGGDYAARLKAFAAGQYDFIVLPINSYLLHGAAHNFPGVIVASIAESRGADAIVGFADKLPTGKVSDLNDDSLKVVFTKDSPSSFLLDLTIADFDLFKLKGADNWKVHAEGSSKVLEQARRHDGDIFVMWEPDVSQALREVPGLVYFYGSDRFSGYIVDGIVFRREFLKAHEADVLGFLEAYFTTISTYRAGDRSKLVEDIRRYSSDYSGLKAPDVEALIRKLDWYDLQDNCSRQFGITNGATSQAVEGVVNTITACTNILLKTGAWTKDELYNPYRIVNSSILRQVQAHLPAELGNSRTKRQFAPLSEAEWLALKEIGVVRVEPITFQIGSAILDEEGQAQVDEIARLLNNNYPDTRVLIKGHTRPGDDEQANVTLSRQRAEAVVERLTTVHGLSANRFRVEGKGASDHDRWLAEQRKRPDFKPQALPYREPRVEFDLFLDDTF